MFLSVAVAVANDEVIVECSLGKHLTVVGQAVVVWLQDSGRIRPRSEHLSAQLAQARKSLRSHPHTVLAQE